MKQKDIALIVGAVFFAALFSFFLSRFLFASPKNRSTKVEVVQSIDSDFPEPDKKFFNPEAIDPTQLIKIGDSTNSQPFNTTQQ